MKRNGNAKHRRSENRGAEGERRGAAGAEGVGCGEGCPPPMGGAAGTAGTAAAIPLLREVQQDKVLPCHILVKKSANILLI